jgi:hypothetical protein
MYPLLRAGQLTVPRAPSCRQLLTGIRRCLHHDASGAGFFDMPLQGRIGIGMDMTRAHGYRISAEVAPPPSHDRLLANFAARHARLSPAQIYHADGFLWLGPVIPAEATQTAEGPYESMRSWDSEDAREALSQFMSDVMEDEAEEAQARQESSDALEVDEQGGKRQNRPSGKALRRRRTMGGFWSSRRAMYAKRRYSGGQARRERARRENSEVRRQSRTQVRKSRNTPPLRKPANQYSNIGTEST